MSDVTTLATLSDTVLVAMFAALPPTVAAVAGLVLAFKNKAKVEEIHKATNSMKDALMLATEKEALGRGHQAGIEAEVLRRKLSDEAKG